MKKDFWKVEVLHVEFNVWSGTKSPKSPLEGNLLYLIPLSLLEVKLNSG